MVHLKVETRDIASIASMAALFVVLSFLPGIPVVGVEQARIGILSAVVPVFGFLMGPWHGGLAALLGALVYRVLLNASSFSWLTLPATALSAFVAGSLGKREVGALRGWIVALIVSGSLTIAWYGTPLGQSVWIYPALHWVSLAIVVIFRDWLAFFIQHGDGWELTISVALSGFAATMATHMYGTLAFFTAGEIGLVPRFGAAFYLGL
ncbi:MAG: ECF transporter S component, partial [Candidatus Bathyarchaeota archaeon]|nr:ECF transporter S component [Candidatus Bathyarchaeota archaeon]